MPTCEIQIMFIYILTWFLIKKVPVKWRRNIKQSPFLLAIGKKIAGKHY